MKSLRSLLYAAALFLILLAACSPGLSPQTSNDAARLRVDSSVATPAAPPDSAITGLQSLTLVHPPMQVGSIDRYFDGSLLDAVPNEGAFMMGSGTPGNPQRPVAVSSFWIYGMEVTNQMYAWCVSLGKCSPPDAKDNANFKDSRYVNYPVVGVTWQQAADYCTFAHGRLPTEAEWEKAASWDPNLKEKRIYPWGDHDPSCDLLNFKYCLNRTTAVTSYGQGASAYGTYNMAGNVFEWVSDWFQQDYYKSAPAVDPTGPQSGTLRVIRSSAYDSDAIYASPTVRFSASPAAHRANLGFRCAVIDPAYFAPYCAMPVSYGVDASTNGASSKPCPDPTITHTVACLPDNTSVDHVTVQSTGPTTVSVNGLQSCDPPNNDVGVAHTCAPGVTIQVSASCGTAPSGAPACPPNYQQDPNNPLQCTSIGGAGACPTGFQYDPQLQCCSVAPANTNVVPLCVVGQHLFGNACVNDYGGPLQPASITYVTGGLDCALLTTGTGSGLIPFPTGTPVPVPTSTPGGGGGGPPPKCDLKPKDCHPLNLDRQTCTCTLLP